MNFKKLLLGSAALLASSQFASAQTFNQFIAFGDSTIDSGYFRYQNCPVNPILNSLCQASKAANGRIPTTPGGPMNSEILASYFGLGLAPVDAPGGGTNFAASGADNNNRNTNANAPSTTEQINTYLASNGGVANGSALYLVSSGGNDQSYAAAQVAAGRFTAAQARTYVTQAGLDLASAVTRLSQAGARYIVVNDYAGGSTTPFTANTRPLFELTALWSTLAANGVPFIPADFKSVQQVVIANPAAFGFTSVSNVDAPGGTACINPNPALIPSSWALYCTPSLLRSPNAAQTALWADDEHLTPAGQKIEADYYYSLIVAPSEISYLAEAPVKTRATVVNTINNQINVSFGQTGAFHGWVTGDVASLKIRNSYNGFPDDPGVPTAVTAGLDYRWTQNWLVGLAFSTGYTRQSFSLGGDYKQREFSASLYGAYRQGPYWLNLIGTTGWLDYDVNREVPLGITVQSNQGSTRGTDFSFAAETGYNFTLPIGTAAAPTGMVTKAPPPPATLYLTHGPVLGIVLQQVRVRGFTETDQYASMGGITALSFGDQRRNSAVTELGWQASYDAGFWKPFARAVWNHELANINREVTASLTTPIALLAGAPAYSMAAVLVGRDWGSTSLGTTMRFSSALTGLVAFNTQFAQHNVTTYGGSVGLNLALTP